MGTIRNGVRLYRATTDFAEPEVDRATTRRRARKDWPDEHFRPAANAEATALAGRVLIALMNGDLKELKLADEAIDYFIAAQNNRPHGDYLIDYIPVDSVVIIERAHLASTTQELCQSITTDDLADTPRLRLEDAERIIARAAKLGLRWKS